MLSRSVDIGRTVALINRNATCAKTRARQNKADRAAVTVGDLPAGRPAGYDTGVVVDFLWSAGNSSAVDNAASRTSGCAKDDETTATCVFSTSGDPDTHERHGQVRSVVLSTRSA